MTRTHPLPLILVCAVTLAGCGLDSLEGKSTSQEAHERRQAQMGVYADAAPIAQPVALLAAVEEPVEPPCFDEFRIRRCVDGVATEWTYTPDPEPIEVAEPLPVVVPVVVEEPCYPIFRVRTCEEVTP